MMGWEGRGKLRDGAQVAGRMRITSGLHAGEAVGGEDGGLGFGMSEEP